MTAFGDSDNDLENFNYLRLRKRIFEHLVDHPACFLALRLRELRTLDRYFLIENGPGGHSVKALSQALTHSQTIEDQEPRIRQRVLAILARVADFEA